MGVMRRLPPFPRFPNFCLYVGALCPVLVATLAHSLPRRSTPPAAHPLVVGYFPQWGLYDPEPYYVKTLVANGSAERLDQINYAQGFVSGGHCSIADANADLNTMYTSHNSVDGSADKPASHFHGYFHQLQELKHRYPKLKILISLEGKASDFAEDAKPENRQAFVASCIDTFIRGHFAAGINKPGIFDGFDVDWESPQEQDAANFRGLDRGISPANESRTHRSAAFDRRGPIAANVAGTDFASLAPLVDQVGIMNYDYAGPWSETTGFIAPLFSSPTPTGPYPSSSIEHSIANLQRGWSARREASHGPAFLWL